jgi:transcriptional regulator with GAF, ATPase, and Fis domain
MPRLTRAGVTGLQNYDWPGNVRELRNVIQRAVILARGGPLNFDLPVTGSSAGLISPRSKTVIDAEGGFLTEAETQRRDRENLISVLAKTGWKIKGPDGAAELLGVKPTTLLARMKKMGLQRPD